MIIPKLPTLAIVSIDKLLAHEHHDETRTRPLVLRIRSSGVFRNPPIVSPLQNGSGQYMVLDGANRTLALAEMDFPHVLVQVVEPDDPGLHLQTWNHIVWEMNPRHFLAGLKAVPDTYIEHIRRDNIADFRLASASDLVLVRSHSKTDYLIRTPQPDLVSRVRILNLLVDTYRERARLDRTLLQDYKTLREIYPMFCGLVVFPQFNIYEVLSLAAQVCLLPSGITRFMISPRALHVNYPLAELESTHPLEEKNQRLHEWLQERLTHKGVRYYAESTVMFDE